MGDTPITDANCWRATLRGHGSVSDCDPELVLASASRHLERALNHAGKLIDADKIIEGCIPGGDACDPQEVAESIREFVARQKVLFRQLIEDAGLRIAEDSKQA